MNFTYASYEGMIRLLQEQGYEIVTYRNYLKYEKCAILRHDVDNSLKQAALLAELEARLGISTTYFVLLSTDFYNVAAAESLKLLKKIAALGHEIGLHFDETKYLTDEKLAADRKQILEAAIAKEAKILSQWIGSPVTCVSMHRPSAETLESNLTPNTIINSYGETFFHQFKYLSDSRRNWREPVEEIIASGMYPRLHLLTHPFWYHETEKSLHDTLLQYVNEANCERYESLRQNIRDLSSIIQVEEVASW